MFSRYNRTPILKMGQQYGMCEALNVIRTAMKNGRLPVKELVLTEAQRLDTLAGSLYGDGRMWFVIAACSNIGWGLQCPPGTILYIPSIEDVSNLIG